MRKLIMEEKQELKDKLRAVAYLRLYLARRPDDSMPAVNWSGSNRVEVTKALEPFIRVRHRWIRAQYMKALEALSMLGQIRERLVDIRKELAAVPPVREHHYTILKISPDS